jgi:hypothetical protein
MEKRANLDRVPFSRFFFSFLPPPSVTCHTAVRQRLHQSVIYILRRVYIQSCRGGFSTFSLVVYSRYLFLFLFLFPHQNWLAHQLFWVGQGASWLLFPLLLRVRIYLFYRVICTAGVKGWEEVEGWEFCLRADLCLITSRGSIDHRRRYRRNHRGRRQSKGNRLVSHAREFSSQSRRVRGRRGRLEKIIIIIIIKRKEKKSRWDK